ncbi:hypothetical protein [Methylobacterium oxalidis]|uniref:DUF4148 domain-containing protein n=1 Tax=Methylobacterium oxalidis TaxID=944322 RepID=A0A512JDS0_9HYPH|nr:hypothetical protein [Methylobacterium oxalidis]GEP08096.1 hypothetical protein MOX02_61340 [Methylobacterium oxalidis]GJE35868.1 hypothetical protein LDDCCGHA_6089 [Methylobacterium oxalidis]GLS63790.1 hypothetical protein GCM10007888_21710 [Methylobacterium oxalidis]
MTVRSAIAAAAVAVSIASVAAPASAQEVRSFDAWGHSFNVPGSQSAAVAVGVRGATVLTTGSIAPERAYASAKSVDENAAAADVQATRTLDVWGARVDAPVR